MEIILNGQEDLQEHPSRTLLGLFIFLILTDFSTPSIHKPANLEHIAAVDLEIKFSSKHVILFVFQYSSIFQLVL